MGKIPVELRNTIARNIRACRMGKFPGRGGAKKCAEAFGVSPQQWSPWERAMRTPDELRLQQIAEFFGVTVEYLRRDNSQPKPSNKESESLPNTNHSFDQNDTNGSLNPFTHLSGIPPTAQPGSPASFFWLAHHFITHLMTNGIKIRLDDDCITLVIRNNQNQS